VEERLMERHALNGENAVVRLEECGTSTGKRLALVTLNSEKTLNSLSLPMIEILVPALAAWRSRTDVVAVLLRGVGERAFSAGGDIQALYGAMARNQTAAATFDGYADAFFEAEYRLDYLLHTYPKPIIAFGHGVVMGGGLGLYSAARFRLATAKTRLAMPEVTIGLFPDAGASWILKALPVPLALFLGATGSPLGGADAHLIGLATHTVSAAAWEDIVAALAALAGLDGSDDDDRRIDTCLRERAVSLAPGPLSGERERIERALTPTPATAIELVAAIEALRGASEWVDRGIDAMVRGCPTSIGIVLEQVRRVASLGLADCFRLELVIATHCARNPDFREGVRALIIDKDNAPKWRYPSVSALPSDYVASHFEPPWPRHPLADLEAT
jgi:enoyl-CoA hydratase/carnithine racemase